MNTTETLKINIDSDDETHGSCSGTQVSLYLIPADETSSGAAEVVTFSNVGPGCPEAAWHGRWHCLGSPSVDFVAESLVEVLESQRDKLQRIADAYLGSEWDGNNHRGKWDKDADIDDVEIDLECETYWDADDWLGGDWPSTDREILAATDLQSLAESYVDNAAGEARLQLDEVLECLQGRAAELQTECMESIVEGVYLYEGEACEVPGDRLIQLRGDWYLCDRCPDGEYRLSSGTRIDEAKAVELMAGCEDEDISGPAKDWLALAKLLA
jgi:hypothetical protein